MGNNILPEVEPYGSLFFLHHYKGITPDSVEEQRHIATLLKIAEIEKLQDLALVDPVEGVVLGDSGCCVRVYYSQKNG